MTNLNKLKQAYRTQPVPDDLDAYVAHAIENGRKRETRKRRLRAGGFAVAASLILATGVLNSNPAIARAAARTPVVGPVAEVLTFRYYQGGQGKQQLSIDTPLVQGLEDAELEQTINAAYLEESRRLYQAFLEDTGGEGDLSVTAGFEVRSDDDELLSIGRYRVDTSGSSQETIRYDTIDKERGLLLTLPALFRDDAYVERLSDYVRTRMQGIMEEDPSQVFFLDSDLPGGFEAIAPDQTFYISETRQLVLVFQEYEVAPGCMGIVEIPVPTDQIEDLLAGHGYLR